MTQIQHRHRGATPPPGRLTSRRRSQAIALGLAALFLMTALFAVVGWVIPGGAAAARADDTSGEQKVAIFEDAVVRPGETWETVVVVGGDLLIQGTVENVVVVVFGDVTIADGARVGDAVNRDDAAVVSVFGDVTEMSGATVRGRTVDVGGWIGGMDLSVADPVLRPWRTGAILNWIWSTVFLMVVAVIITAIAPRQVAVVRDRVRGHFFSSLGWGALGVIIGVPIATAALIISIIGIILVVPWLTIVLPLISLFGLVGVGAMVGRLILGAREDKRETVMLAAVLGVVIINVARWIPVGWIVILGVLWLVGFGATYVSIWVWLRDRRRRKREAAERERAARAVATSPQGGQYPGIPWVVPPPGSPPAPSGPPSSAPPATTPVPQSTPAPEAATSSAPGSADPVAGTAEDVPSVPEADVATTDAQTAAGPEGASAEGPAAAEPDAATESTESKQPDAPRPLAGTDPTEGGQRDSGGPPTG